MIKKAYCNFYLNVLIFSIITEICPKTDINIAQYFDGGPYTTNISVRY